MDLATAYLVCKPTHIFVMRPPNKVGNFSDRANLVTNICLLGALGTIKALEGFPPLCIGEVLYQAETFDFGKQKLVKYPTRGMPRFRQPEV